MSSEAPDERAPTRQQHAEDKEATNEPTTSKRPVIFGLAGLGIGLVAGLLLGTVAIPATLGVGERFADAVGGGPIPASVETCEVADNRWITVGDDGASLTMNSFGAESDGADLDEIFCVLKELEAPDSVTSLIESTRALDGRQTATWNDLAASWGYHPDDGLDIVIEVERN
ncbi:hypothetical protein ACLRGF_14390 [Mycetocola zhadangensis]|uniref:hypothetical protein n=1 Tax=Mycetocola zhadangensis TaxID=1164595 RepID=UPI003A4DDF1A